MQTSLTPFLSLPGPKTFQIYEIIQNLGYAATGKQLNNLTVAVGKAVASQYRARYNKEPETNKRFVDGAVRDIKAYHEKDLEWICPIVHNVCTSKGYSLLPRKN